MRCYLIALFASAVSVATVHGHEMQGGAYLGRWYEGTDRSVCKEQPGTADGLLVYSAKEAIGLENWCRVAGAKTVGPRTDLTLQCRAEGRAERSRESLEVVGGRLKRTIAEGRKQYVFVYNRCP